MEKHPDKTFIGRIAKGFDFLGYSFEPKGLSIAPKTLANFLERKTQLYEQGATVRRIGQYVRNWQGSAAHLYNKESLAVFRRRVPALLIS